MSKLTDAGPGIERWQLIAGGIVIVAVATITALVVGGNEPGGGADPGDALEDGNHFAFITGIDTGGLIVDQAVLFTGDAAIAAAVADGFIEPGEELPGEIYIRNPDETSLGMPVADEAVYTVYSLGSTGELVEREINHGLLRTIYEDPVLAAEIYGFVPDSFPVTLTVSDGLITDFKQVYLP